MDRVPRRPSPHFIAPRVVFVLHILYMCRTVHLSKSLRRAYARSSCLLRPCQVGHAHGPHIHLCNMHHYTA